MRQLLSGFTVDQDYVERLANISEFGNVEQNRTGTDSVSLFGESARFNLRNGRVPVVGLKHVPLKTISHELIWFLSGSTSIKYLKENNVHIWDSWVEPSSRKFKISEDQSKFNLGEWFSAQYPDRVMVQGETVHDVVANNYPAFEAICPLIDGDLPHIYQEQWFKWEDTITVIAEEYYERTEYYTNLGYAHQGTYNCNDTDIIKVVLRRYINQYEKVLDTLKTNPSCRRMIIEGWNVGKIDQMALPPCHKSLQFYTSSFTTDERIKLGLDEKIITKKDSNVIFTLPTELQAQKLTELGVPEYGLSSMLYMRSSDQGVGYNFNIAQYAVITHIIGKMTNMYPLDFIWVGADVHVYADQWDFKDEEGMQGGVTGLILRYNEISTEDNEGPVYVPIVDTHEEAVMNKLTLEHPIKYPFVKLSDRIKSLGSTDLDKITFEDIEFTEYKHMGRCPFPKAAV